MCGEKKKHQKLLNRFSLTEKLVLKKIMQKGKNWEMFLKNFLSAVFSVILLSGFFAIFRAHAKERKT